MAWLRRLIERFLHKPLVFLREPDIARDFIRSLDDESKQQWREMEESDLIRLHHSVGRYIRNHYHLWHEDNPFTGLDDPMDEKFPDQMSQRVIMLIWKRLQETA